MSMMHMKYYFRSFIFLSSFLQLSFQCHSGILDSGPYSQSVNGGENVSFFCAGHGSHLYWFIDGINTVNMSSQEISNRGLSFSGYYNQGPPYNGVCNYQSSYLIMAGNCLNNNTEIYCVILGRFSDPSIEGGNKTSSVASLVMKGDGATLISQFTAVQTKIDSLLMYWKLESISNLNYTQTITVEEGTTTVYSMELDKLDQTEYLYYKSKKTFDPCIQYNITLNIDATCISDTLTVVKYLSGKPMKPRLVSALDQESKLITFQFDNSLCQGSLPSTILVLLNDNNGDLISSDVIPWGNVTILSDELYEIELNDVDLKDNGYYYLSLISQSEYGQAISDPVTISTFDVIDAHYSFINDTAEFCVTCIFANKSLAIGCIAVLFTTTNIYSMKITRDTSSNNGSDCVIVGNSGLYSISVYDWEGNDDDILRNEPAVKTIMYLESQSGSIIQTSHTTRTISTTAGCLLSQTVIESQQQHVNGDTVGLIFGTLFGVSLLLLLVISVALGVLVIVRRKKSSNARSSSTSNNRSNEVGTPMQMNSAYELMGEQQVNCNPSSHVTMKEGHDYITDVYDTFIADPVKNEQCYRLLPPPTAPTNTHIYANIHRY